MPLLSLDQISKSYGEIRALDALSFSIEHGQILGLLGPSGCGKTTTLRIILGLEKPDSGAVKFEERDITGTPAEQRGFGMVFQNFALFTKLNGFENVAFGMKSRVPGADDITERVASTLEMVRLPGYQEKRVEELSAGEQQRVAIARAIAMEPPLLLFDEPLSNLDAALRRETRGELRQLITRLGLAAVYVTHDQEEAFSICDHIAVMTRGRIEQTGTPLGVYDHPSTPSVVRFFGLNLIQAERVSLSKHGSAEFRTIEGNRVLRVAVSGSQADYPESTCLLAIRPEDIEFGAAALTTRNRLRATVREVTFTGPTTKIKLAAGTLRFEALSLRSRDFRPGEECLVGIPEDRITVLRGRCI